MPHNGSATSSKPGTSPPATLTSAASLTCGPTISAATPNVTSSPASEDGRLLSDLPAGPTIDLFGQAHAPASRSQPPARARRPMTSAICGLRGFLSSPSAALQQSLESRLKRRLDGAGSTLFSLTWKAKATPAGRPYCQLAASARRTSDSDFGLSEHWPTPQSLDGAYSRSGQPERTGGGRRNLDDYATLVAWATPTSRDHKDGACNLDNVPVNALMGRQALLAISGPTPNGLPAQTEKPGQLDPDHSRWVMGYSAEHLSCAPTETPSFLKSRRSSSHPIASLNDD